MTTRATSPTAERHRCKGSASIGIDPHEAPVSEFPKQPSRKDGLGVMCTEHWRAYVKGLREARRATAVEFVTTEGEVPLSQADAAKVTRAVRSTKTTTLPADATALVDAEALIAEVDALSGPEALRRNGHPDVQAALETVAAAKGGGRHAAAETPLSETIDGGTEDAAAE